jgi:hypothetical protein
MRRKRYTIAASVLFLVTAATQLGPSPCQILRSAKVVHENFRSLDGAKTNLSPVEKLVFSLMLGSGEEEKETRGAVPHRTS